MLGAVVLDVMVLFGETELVWVLLPGETVTVCVVMVTEEPFAELALFGEGVVMVTLGVAVLLFVVVASMWGPCVAAGALLVGLGLGLGLDFMAALVDADMLSKVELVSLLVELTV